jgi:hypothetical protein
MMYLNYGIKNDLYTYKGFEPLTRTVFYAYAKELPDCSNTYIDQKYKKEYFI